MNYGGRIIEDMSRLVALFAPHCLECSTLDELGRMIIDHKQWSKGHDLFDRIRHKTIADRDGDRTKSTQYLFEEVCAKTLYNLSLPSDAFDPNSPYWIVPNAFALCRALGLDDSVVLDVVAG
jgi:hypothetical protein